MESTERNVDGGYADLFEPPASLAASNASTSALIGGIAVVGRLRGFDLDDSPLIGDLACCPGRVIAGRSTVPLRSAMRGRDVVVLFDGGDIDKPLIIGVIEPNRLDAAAVLPAAGAPTVVVADGERQVLSAEREIVLRCGEASITLTRAGKVVISGTYVVSRSSGPNKIKGGTIDLN